jgi:excinuclease ABC subunit C
MKEVTYRRYQKLLLEQGTFPDLILVDGGKGQLNAAKRF